MVGVSVGWDEERDWASGDHAEGESRSGNKDGGELHFEFGGGGGGWRNRRLCCEESDCDGKECELEAERTVVICSSSVELMSCV